MCSTLKVTAPVTAAFAHCQLHLVHQFYQKLDHERDITGGKLTPQGASAEKYQGHRCRAVMMVWLQLIASSLCDCSRLHRLFLHPANHVAKHFAFSVCLSFIECSDNSFYYRARFCTGCCVILCHFIFGKNLFQKVCGLILVGQLVLLPVLVDTVC